MNAITTKHIVIYPIPTVVEVTPAEMAAVNKVLGGSPHATTPAETALYRSAMAKAGTADTVQLVVAKRLQEV